MDETLLSSLSALVALIPAAMTAWRPVRPGEDGRDRLFWAALAVAMLGPGLWAWSQVAGSWETGLSAALWVTVAACMLLFAGLCRFTGSAWRLGSLLLPYLLLLGGLATLVDDRTERALRPGQPDFWIDLHIGVSVVTYALVTLAALAALAAFVQERALKTKRPNRLSRALPSVRESEGLQRRLLAGSEAVLGAGLLSGMALLFYRQGSLLRLDHKTLFSFASFGVIGILLIAQARSGVRGRLATRLVLVAYLLLTLAYPGVKFVRQILIGGMIS
jgi:ABC-type uncharacterized transport system permease subunit